MKQLFIIISVIASVLLASCENDPQELFSGDEAIYFTNFTETADSITYSFIGKNREMDTVYLEVKLLGNMLETPKNFEVNVISEQTTAIEGDHYEALLPSYEFSTNSFEYQLPIILKRHSDLDNGAYVLAIELVENNDFEIAYSNMAKARIMFSNIIMKPSIWDATLAPLFGVYSKTKHAICMDIMGRPFPETDMEYNIDRNTWRNYGWECNAYFENNIVMDNDLVPPARILPWF